MSKKNFNEREELNDESDNNNNNKLMAEVVFVDNYFFAVALNDLFMLLLRVFSLFLVHNYSLMMMQNVFKA